MGQRSGLPSNRALLGQFLKHMSRTKSPRTVYQYGMDLEKFVDHLGATHIVQSTVDDLNAWVDRPRGKTWGAVVAPATLKREMMELRSFYRFLCDREVIARDPARLLEAPKVDNELPHPVPVGVWREFWRRGDLDDELRVACGLGYFGGLRRHEITGLRPEQFVGPKLTIAGLQRKGGKRQAFPLASCVDMYAQRLPWLIGDPRSFLGPLERLLAARAGELSLLPWDGRQSRHNTFTKWERPVGMVHPQVLNDRLERAKAGFSPHDMRHSFGTNMVRPRPQGCGVPLQIVTKLMGHADPRVTMRYLEVGADPLGDLLNVDDEGEAVGTYGPWGR